MKNKLYQIGEFIFWVLVMALCITVFLSLTNCSPAPHWRLTRNTGIEKYEYNVPIKYDYSCTHIYSRQPIKRSSMRKQIYFNPRKK